MPLTGNVLESQITATMKYCNDSKENSAATAAATAASEANRYSSVMNHLDGDSFPPISPDESRESLTQFHDMNRQADDTCDFSDADLTPYDWNTCRSPPRKRRLHSIIQTAAAVPTSSVVTEFDSFSPFGKTRVCHVFNPDHEEAFLLSELVATEPESLLPFSWLDQPPSSPDASTWYLFESDRHQLTPSPASIGQIYERLHERLSEQAILSPTEHWISDGFQGAALLSKVRDGATSLESSKRKAALSSSNETNIRIVNASNATANKMPKEPAYNMTYAVQTATTPPSLSIREVGAIRDHTKFPVPFSTCMDTKPLSRYQVFLVRLIEVFEASDDDIHTYVKGRNKSVQRGQVGLRCRHCANLPVAYHSRGSTYFPSALVGIYQAAQNMSKNHVAICTELPEEDRKRYETIVPKKPTSSKTGKNYWAKCAQTLGLEDTDNGIFRIKTSPRKSNNLGVHCTLDV